MQDSTIGRAVRERAMQWRRKLVSLDRRNPMLYFRPLKAGTLELPSLEADDLLSFANEGRPLDLSAALDQTPDVPKRVLAIRAKAKENEEERGLQTMFVALGMAVWKATDGGRDPKAPMFLLPVSIADTVKGPQLLRSGDLVINRVMLQAWDQEHHLEVPEFSDDDPIEMPIGEAFSLLAAAGETLEGFQVLSECQLSNFSFAKLAMVEDLRRHEDLLGENRLVRAIAGDIAAQRAIREDAGSLERDELDAIEPSEELIVLEADEYQRQAIHSLTRFEADGVIDGPPGTGKSQTIANLIAALVGAGKKVLFVAEKRAALDAVRNRLNDAGLADLLLDLHGADTKRKAVYDRLRERDERARNPEPPPPLASNKRLKQLRSELNGYYRAINTALPACNLSPRDLVARLAKLDPAVHVETRWFGQSCRSLTAAVQEDSRREVELLARDADVFRRDPTSPWACASFEDQEAVARGLQTVSESRIALQDLVDHLRLAVSNAAAPAPRSFTQLEEWCELAMNLSAAAKIFREEILTQNLDALVRGLQPAGRNSLTGFFAWLTSSSYRSALRLARSASTSSVARPERLLQELHKLCSMPAERRVAAFFRLCTPAYAEAANSLRSTFVSGRKTLDEVAGIVLPDGVDEAIELLRTLESESRIARRVPEVRRAEKNLTANGYAPLVDELRKTNASPTLWGAMLERAWLQSQLDEARTQQPVLGSFSRLAQEQLIKEFREIDARQIELARATVRRGAARAYIEARNANPDQAMIFRAEANKKTRLMPIRKLVASAGDVITALCPCWMASPLSVSQLIDGRVLFDVVIFDEASQVLPEDAVPSIMRARRTVVAGDQKQLPPTIFFAAGSADTDEDDDGEAPDSGLVTVSLEGMESILDVMLTFCNRQYLNIHYRSRDESLIRFSNHEFYLDRLITFPGPAVDGRIRHVLVDSPFVDGEELSSSAEIARVTDLVFEHAEQRPGETLGVIAMGIKHARRLEASIAERRKAREDLDSFFTTEDVNRAFFVKNLERVQGDERDAIILSLGYAKDASGRLKNKLSALNHSGGERRLNVAVSRSKTRMTLVSTFTEDDMEASRFSAIGAQKLCRFIEYARSSGRRLSDVSEVDVEMNEFERDVYDTLSAKGLHLIPQLGVSEYRLDFAVVHPEMPNRYVLAIECDGAPYHSSATARDRDRLRQQHLEAMGWRFHRIWSLDWHEERPTEVERVMAAYAAALSAAKEAAADFEPPRPRLASNGAPPPKGAALGRGAKPDVPY